MVNNSLYTQSYLYTRFYQWIVVTFLSVRRKKKKKKRKSNETRINKTRRSQLKRLIKIKEAEGDARASGNYRAKIIAVRAYEVTGSGRGTQQVKRRGKRSDDDDLLSLHDIDPNIIRTLRCLPATFYPMGVFGRRRETFFWESLPRTCNPDITFSYSVKHERSLLGVRHSTAARNEQRSVDELLLRGGETNYPHETSLFSLICADNKI